MLLDSKLVMRWFMVSDRETYFYGTEADQRLDVKGLMQLYYGDTSVHGLRLIGIVLL